MRPNAGPSRHFAGAVLIHPPNRSSARAIPKPAPQDPKNAPDFVKLDRKTVHPYEKGLDEKVLENIFFFMKKSNFQNVKFEQNILKSAK